VLNFNKSHPRESRACLEAESMKSIYTFSTSTDFFRDAFRKKGRTTFFTKKLGYSSPRLIEMICQGKRFASTDFLFRSKQLLQLTDQEFLYLSLLVKRDRNQSKKINDSDLEEQIKNISTIANNKEFLDDQHFRLIADWPHLVLKQYFRKPRATSAKELSKKLRNKISEKEVQKVVETLKNLGIISVKENGNIEPLFWKGYLSPTDIPSQAIRSHHKQMMERAIEALEEISLLEREITSVTFSMNPKNIVKVKKEIQEFKNRIDRMFDETSDSVFQLNVQFFPHIKEKQP
jgi:uncharacterized protein (TIGR02147 family)